MKRRIYLKKKQKTDPKTVENDTITARKEKKLMELNEVQEFLDRQKWIFAKTYADKAPHEYCLLRQVNGTKEEFKEVARFIKQEGIPGYFYRAERNYLFYDDRMYWAMDDNIDDVILINRCNIDEYNVYKYGDAIQVTWKGPKR